MAADGDYQLARQRDKAARASAASELGRLGDQFAGLIKSSQLAANKSAGDAASDAIASQFAIPGREVPFKADSGWRRVDVFIDGHAIESKVGRTSLTAATKRQIQRDVELRADKNSEVESVAWHFRRSDVTGKIGSTPALEAALECGQHRYCFPMNEHWELYRPYQPPFTGPLRELPRAEAKACYDAWFASRPARWDALRKLTGLRLDGTDAAFQDLNDWFLALIERNPTDPGRLANRWYAVVNDVGVVLGDTMIDRSPNLRWKFWVSAKTSNAYQSQVIAGFTRTVSPGYHVNINGVIATYGMRATSGATVDPDRFLRMLREAAEKA